MSQTQKKKENKEKRKNSGRNLETGLGLWCFM